MIPNYPKMIPKLLENDGKHDGKMIGQLYENAWKKNRRVEISLF